MKRPLSFFCKQHDKLNFLSTHRFLSNYAIIMALG